MKEYTHFDYTKDFYGHFKLPPEAVRRQAESLRVLRLEDLPKGKEVLEQTYHSKGGHLLRHNANKGVR